MIAEKQLTKTDIRKRLAQIHRAVSPAFGRMCYEIDCKEMTLTPEMLETLARDVKQAALDLWALAQEMKRAQ